MKRKNIYLLIFIVVLFGVSLWSIVPFGTKLLGSQGLNLGLDLRGGSYLVYQADLSSLGPDENPDEIMEGMKKAIERRIDILGLSQPVVQVVKQAGEYGIAIQLPGASESQTEEVKGKMVALLTFMEQDSSGNWTPATGVVGGEELTLTSRYFQQNTYIRLDSLNRPLVIFHWDETGQELSAQVTGRLIGKPLAIYLGAEPLRGEDGHIIAPTVQSVIRESGQIEGLSANDAQELSDLLNAGRVSISLGHWSGEGGSRTFTANVPLYERTVDATLGSDSIHKSILAAIIGIILLLLFMIVYYRLPGL